MEKGNQEIYNCAISAVNYMFLRETFGFEKYSESIINEISEYLNEINKCEKLDTKIKAYIFKELLEGDYLNDQSLEQVKAIIKNSILKISGNDLINTYTRYISVAKEAIDVMEVI